MWVPGVVWQAGGARWLLDNRAIDVPAGLVDQVVMPAAEKHQVDRLSQETPEPQRQLKELYRFPGSPQVAQLLTSPFSLRERRRRS
jgi:hypothetical protein